MILYYRADCSAQHSVNWWAMDDGVFVCLILREKLVLTFILQPLQNLVLPATIILPVCFIWWERERERVHRVFLSEKCTQVFDISPAILNILVSLSHITNTAESQSFSMLGSTRETGATQLISFIYVPKTNVWWGWVKRISLSAPCSWKWIWNKKVSK